jgi:hypothetical protein
MRPNQISQPWLPFPSESLWGRLPDQNRQQARDLLARLLREVILAEHRQRSAEDEQREDHVRAS